MKDIVELSLKFYVPLTFMNVLLPPICLCVVLYSDGTDNQVEEP